MPVPRRVLIVEDDAAIAALLRRALNSAYDVSVSEDGVEALAAAERLRPHLVLLDVNLPKMNGFEVARALKESEELRRTIIVFLTARDHSMDVISGINAGAKHYITKPFRVEDVVGKVQKLLPPPLPA